MTVPPSTSSHTWRWFFAWILLTIYFVTPPRESFDQSLDKSNYATYAHFVAQGTQWGADVIPVTGPYGFILYGHTYSGEMFWERLLGDLLLKAAISLLILHLFRRAGPGVVRWVWLIALICLVPTVDDLFHDYAILLAGLCVIANFDSRSRWWCYFATVLLGYLALFKGTHLITTAATFCAIVLLGLIERRPRMAIGLATIFAGSVIVFWLIAGQNPANLFGYVRDVFEISSGYNATMGMDELLFVFVTGISLLIGLIILLAWTAKNATRAPRLLVSLMLVAGFTYLKWKHGFLRADGHVAIFFTAAPMLALTTNLINFSSLLGIVAPLSARQRLLRLGLVTGIVGAGVIGSAEFWLRRVAAIATDVPARLQQNARYLTRPMLVRARMAEELERIRNDNRLPQARNEVGAEPIDFFGFEQGILLLNHFNYHPRPVGGGSFSTFTARLQQINGDFIADNERAPAWQLFKLQTIDDRLPAGDDPLTLLGLLYRHSPLLIERDYLLFRRRPAAATPEPVLIQTIPVQAGQTVVVPNVGDDEILLFTLESSLSMAGRLRSFFYRPPHLAAHIVADQNPRGRDYRLGPSMLQHPVILSPLLRNNADVLRLLAREPGNRVQALRLDPAPGFSPEEFDLKFYRLPRPPVPVDPDVSEMRTLQRHPVHNREPVSIVTGETATRDLNKEPIVLVHAPGSITWDLQSGDQQVVFSYGLMPQAYTDGKTDGVEFNVEVLWPPNDGRVIFQHMLRPRTVAADRGIHHARLFLPPFEPGAQLRIRTHPGPDNDGAFDQSYITRWQVKSGALDPRQFSGLGIVPADERLPHESAAGISGRPVYLIHAPGEVALRVPHHASELSCEIGLLPGAYKDGGNTDGVGFTFWAIAADGERQKLFSRTLEPLHRTSDQGPQLLTIPLPRLPGESKIQIMTDIGPGEDRSWDQSYVAGVKFK